MSEEDICKQCGSKCPSNRWSFCSTECRRQFNKDQYRLNNPYKGTTTGTTGAISEMRAAVDLMAKGYHVFRSLSPSCPCDLVILKNGRLLRIQVRTTFKTVTGRRYNIKRQGDDYQNTDVYAWVLPDEIIYEPLLE